MNPIIKSNAIKYGVIAGVIGLVYAIGVYAIDENLFVKLWWITLLVQLLGIALFVVAVVQVRKQMGGYINFKEAFSTFVISAVISIAIGLVANILLFQVIDNELGPRLQEKILISMSERYDKMGIDDAKQAEMLASYEAQDTFSMATQFKSTLYGIVVMSVIGAIVALILKRNKGIEWTNPETLDTHK